MDPRAERYERDYRKMLDAGRQWLTTSCAGHLEFDFSMGIPGGGFIIAALTPCVDQVGKNAVSRDFLRILDQASNHAATLAMARMVVDELFSVKGSA
jgi:hypothetical protein